MPGLKSGDKQPRPIILDTHLSILKFNHLNIRNPIVVTIAKPEDDIYQDALVKLKPVNGEILSVGVDINGKCNISEAFVSLKRIGINSVLVEGGATIIQSLLSSGLCNQVIVTIRPSFLGGYRSLTNQLDKIVELGNIHMAVVGGDIILLGNILSSRYSANSCIDNGPFVRSNIEFIKTDTPEE